ncbi:MAG: GAF domain-containing sensor histidine kinase [Spirulinaceae cyanobacterium]
MDGALTAQNTFLWQDLGAELVFTQDGSGQYLSFLGPVLAEKRITPSEVSLPDINRLLHPVDADNYLATVQRVMERRVPENYHCLFAYDDRTFALELVISPILKRHGGVTNVLVMGRLIEEEILNHHAPLPATLSEPNYQDLVKHISRSIRRNPYQNLLNRISRNIHLTLDLEILWQQTVTLLGDGLNVTRCLIISFDEEDQIFKVDSEYCDSAYPSMLGERLAAATDSYLQQTMLTSEPLAVEYVEHSRFGVKSMLSVSTFYKNKRNALICLQQCDRRRNWNDAEIALIQELAAHVGTATAHAHLYRELEQASQRAADASRLKSQFLASTSHELRTPLNGIIGFLRLILDDMADDEAEKQEFLVEAHKSALHLLNIINDILDIAKIESGQMEFEFTEVSLNDLLEDVEAKMRSVATQKGLSFEIMPLPSSEPLQMYGDYQRLLQILLNLVGNAIKFTHDGGITISTELMRHSISVRDRILPGMIKLRVADTGIGVPLDKRDKLFQHFSQVDASRTKAYGGTGLGLAISQRLVETMGGSIEFFSMGENLGSTVTFTVPVVDLPLVKKRRALFPQ